MFVCLVVVGLRVRFGLLFISFVCLLGFRLVIAVVGLALVVIGMFVI